jgi:hypothetical protein
MPFILVALFAIALLITFAGLFLSPRSQVREARSEYLAVPRSRHMVDAAPAQERPGQHVASAAPLLAPEKRRMRESEPLSELELRRMITRTTAPIPARASRPSRPDSRMNTNTRIERVERRVVERRPSMAVAAPPGMLGDWRDRLSDWRVLLPGLCALFLLTFYLFGTVLPQPVAWTSVLFGSTSLSPTPKVVKQSTPTTYTASRDLMRISQLDPAQYASNDEYNTWAYSACSAASMTEVIDSYGHKYRITDILNVESKIGEITPDEGLLEESGIAHTGQQFGFKTTWGHNLNLDQVIAIANSGTPVIVSWPPDRWAGGHILVVRGGDSNNVDLADSSRLDYTQMARSRFLQLWEGFYAVMTPK